MHSNSLSDDLPKNGFINSIDLTSEFFSIRQDRLQKLELERLVVKKRFIKLTNLQAEIYIWHSNYKSSVLLFLTGSTPEKYSKQEINDAQREIVGTENWQDDHKVTHCGLCQANFDLFNRKHHCRLCGIIVDERFLELRGIDNSCSALIPIAMIMKMLPNLNYSPVVRENWNVLCNVNSFENRKSQYFSFRCCKSCKNILIHDAKAVNHYSTANVAILEVLDDYLSLKSIVNTLIVRFQNDKEMLSSDASQLLRLKKKMVECIENLEAKGNLLKQKTTVFRRSSRSDLDASLQRMTNNMYKSVILFLLEAIQHLEIMNKISQVDHSEATRLSKFELTQESLTLAVSVELNKREIRERREQLMVINEQKFLVQNLIKKTRGQRKFDEIEILEESMRDLELRGAELVAELGEFGF